MHWISEGHCKAYTHVVGSSNDMVGICPLGGSPKRVKKCLPIWWEAQKSVAGRKDTHQEARRDGWLVKVEGGSS